MYVDSVKLSVVSAKSERVVLLAYEHDVARPWTCYWFDNAVSLRFFNLFVNNIQVLEGMSYKSLSDREISPCIDVIFDVRCPTDAILPFGEDSFVLNKELFSSFFAALLVSSRKSTRH